jgi:hypothetical protein
MQPIASDGPIVANDLENDFDRIPIPTAYGRLEKLVDYLNNYFNQNIRNFCLQCRNDRDFKILTKKIPSKFFTIKVTDLGNRKIRVIMQSILN